jgi:hypothetical protein
MSLYLLQVDFPSKSSSAGWIFDKGGIELELRLLFILVRTLIALLYCENQHTCSGVVVDDVSYFAVAILAFELLMGDAVFFHGWDFTDGSC